MSLLANLLFAMTKVEVSAIHVLFFNQWASETCGFFFSVAVYYRPIEYSKKEPPNNVQFLQCCNACIPVGSIFGSLMGSVYMPLKEASPLTHWNLSHTAGKPRRGSG